MSGSKTWSESPDWIKGYEHLMDGGNREILLRQAYSILSDYQSSIYDHSSDQAAALEDSAHKVREAVGADWVPVWMQLNDHAAEHAEERKALHEHATKIVEPPPRANQHLADLVRLMKSISAGVRDVIRLSSGGGKKITYAGSWGWSDSMESMEVTLDVDGVPAHIYLTDDDEDIIMEGVQSGKYVPSPEDEEEDEEDDDEDE